MTYIPASSPLVDGDKGDVVVSGSGTVWTIDSASVTNAKLADAAAYTLKMRNAGTSGSVSDVKVSSLTDEPTPVAGDYLLGETGGTLVRIDVGNLPGGGGGTTASNVGTAGVGVFDAKVGVDLQFKKINAGSTKVKVTDDVANNEVDIDVDVATLEPQVNIANLANAGTAAQSDTADFVATPAGNGIVAHTGVGAASARTITAGDATITVTNGDGVAGNPTVAVGEVPQASVTGLVTALSAKQDVGTDQLMHDLLMEILFEIRQVCLHLQEITNERFDQ